MKKVEVKNIHMNYHSMKGETPALDNVSFSVDEGKFITIVGPSGCGKSTLLNIIVGLLTPSSGEIYLDGEKITSSSSFGYMFQRDHLFEWLTVWENVILGLKIQHRIHNDSIDKINTLLTNYKLVDFKNHYPKELSGGMRQRVALIRTLALEPKVLLLDEPFSALDYQTRLNVGDEIYEIIRKENKTVIMVTHDISEAISLSNRVLILSKRPATIVRDVEISFPVLYDSPLKRREAPEFREYFDIIWKELNKNGK